MLIGIPKEQLCNEYRVAATPNTITEIIKLGFRVIVEYDAGKLAHFSDNMYAKSGAKLGDKFKIWQSDIIIKVNSPNEEEINLCKKGAILISFINPAENKLLMEKLSKSKMTVLSMDTVPRISKAQSLDALSSMANIAGYRAVIEAAYAFGRFFTGQITAAGKIPPAKVMIIGAGVAGLSAIGTASSLGAIVNAFDTRIEVKEQVESMGAKFLELNFKDQSKKSRKDGYANIMSEEFIIAEKELLKKESSDMDIIITTAMIPGQPAPKLISADMISNMKTGSVIVDIAAQNGGNTELTVPNKTIITDNGITIIGHTNLPSHLSNQSSQLYSNNTLNLLKLLCHNKDGKILINLKNEIIRHITVIHNGTIIWPAPKINVSSEQKVFKQTIAESIEISKNKKSFAPIKKCIILSLISICFIYFGSLVPSNFLSHFIILFLSCIVGYYVVWNVSYALHTPLMSVTNAISGIIMLGAILQIGHGNHIINILAFISILITSINIFGGFNVTYKMLKMFRKY